MITYSSEKYRSGLMEMWEMCFSDTPLFIEFYFRNVYKAEETLIFREDGQAVAALQMIPYSIRINETIYPAIYISGAMTHPEYQNRGIMSELLIYALKEMERKEVSLSFLIPQKEWLFRFYEKFGYQCNFPLKTELIPPSNETFSCITKEWNGIPNELYPHYFSFLQQQENVVLKSEIQFEHILQDLRLDNGKIYTVNSGEKGIAFVVPTENGVNIKDLFATNETIRKAMIQNIQQEFPLQKIQLTSLQQEEKANQSGMIRIIDSSQFPNGLPTNIHVSLMLE